MITLREIYDGVQRCEEKIDGLGKELVGVGRTLEVHDRRFTEQDQRLEQIVARLEKLEERRWPVPNVTVVMAIGSLAVAVAALILS